MNRRPSRSPSLRQLQRKVAKLERENRALRAAQARKHDGEADFRQVINASPVPLSVDDMRGNIEYLNQKFVDTFGYSREEIPTSAAWFNHAYPDPEYRRQVGRQWQDFLERGLRSGKEIGPLEVEVTCKDGSIRRMAFVGTLMGKKLLIAAADITERERLEQQIVKISEDERERIGQDLHDGLCQLLSGIKFKITLLEQKLQAGSLDEARDAQKIEGLLNTAIQQARNIARGLHPVELEAEGLMGALKNLAATVTGVYGIPCACRISEPVLIHDHTTATHLYRIAQEGINNALRHAQARRISIQLVLRRDRLRLSVRDNGKGLAATGRRRSGMGLHLMNYRARAMGAHLELRSRPGAGTTVVCWLHLPGASTNK